MHADMRTRIRSVNLLDIISITQSLESSADARVTLMLERLSGSRSKHDSRPGGDDATARNTITGNLQRRGNQRKGVRFYEPL